METSLSVQNDAILKKAKWWIVSALVLILIANCFTHLVLSILQDFYLRNYELMADLNNLHSIWKFIVVWIKPTLNILYIIGCVALLKHSVKSIRVFGKILLIFSVTNILFGIMNGFVWDGIFQNLFEEDYWVWPSTIIPNIERFISQFILLMGFSALWKNKQIRENYTAVISLFALLIFVEFVIFIPSDMWSIRGAIDLNHKYHYLCDLLDSGWYIPRTIFIVTQILIIYCYCKLLKTPSAMPVEDTEPYSYRPTKIEIGFLFSVCLFVGLIFLSFLMV